MACCVCSLLGSKSWILLLIPIFAVLASLSSCQYLLFIPILVLFSTFVFIKLPKQKPIKVQENLKSHETEEVVSEKQETEQKKEVERSEQQFLIQPQDFYSESESLDQFSTTSSEDDHSSDAEQRLDCSDDSISDEESLIEIAIPSGEFVSSPKKDQNSNFKFCKLSAQKQYGALDFLTEMNNEMNEEDNLIEIDIYMGSIKYSSYGISTRES